MNMNFDRWYWKWFRHQSWMPVRFRVWVIMRRLSFQLRFFQAQRVWRSVDKQRRIRQRVWDLATFHRLQKAIDETIRLTGLPSGQR